MPAFDSITFFNREVTLVAREVLGAEFLVDGVGGLIVETEAYHPTDPASHSYRGRTERNASMFLGPGHVYVYRSYGIHWCFNFVCADASAILIRAIEPTVGIEKMAERRGLADTRALCSGPGKLGQALAVTRAHDGLMIDAPPFQFRPAESPRPVVIGPRIGITKAADLPWRFGIAGSAFLSKAFRPASE
ncbi:3-methyladenine DNA glycosylase [Devosia insulae DS-56]|uniref:Putative 3-methyladenine DNA glycosylase n=1 Tax=Devosia insulae DS-56 TaxID=1116389 RepID=A0A1E5XPN2_9HYPH|nr:DNA-3-methyladenine glycosylase [Devosia insulae]OEO30529.1 3-methyladenine DNA glycosylase [Devosia insulae DS-56]